MIRADIKNHNSNLTKQGTLRVGGDLTREGNQENLMGICTRTLIETWTVIQTGL